MIAKLSIVMKNDSVITRLKAYSCVHPFIFNIKTTHGLQFYPFFLQNLSKVTVQASPWAGSLTPAYGDDGDDGAAGRLAPTPHALSHPDAQALAHRLRSINLKPKSCRVRLSIYKSPLWAASLA
ncbi:hypothetical protein SODG_004641 [Sodalis praecaptivus]